MLLDFKDDKYKRKILCFLDGVHRFELFYAIARNNSDMLFVIYSNISNFEEVFYQHEISNLPNVMYAIDKQLFLKSKAFGLHISTWTQPTSDHLTGLKIIKLCNKLNIPVFEIQHGMFQLGMHYHSNAKKINAETFNIETYADKILAYYPAGLKREIVIGYPGFDDPPKAISGDYTLVLSNLHWQTYQKLNVYKFYHAVIKYAAKHSEQVFVWQPHPGEIANGGLNNLLLKSLFSIYPKAKKNFINIKENPVSNLIPTNEWIRKAGRVVSTISTVLLECEMYQKPTIIWECEDTKVLLDKIKIKASFKDYADLCQVNDLPDEELQLKSGLLLPYDNNAFRQAVETYYHEPMSGSSDLLANILEDL